MRKLRLGEWVWFYTGSDTEGGEKLFGEIMGIASDDRFLILLPGVPARSFIVARDRIL